MDIIRVSHLTKTYKDITAVNNLSFTVKQGQLFSFLGPNGAGKSTTINTLCTLLDYEKGEIIIDGHDLKTNSGQVRQAIGVVFQESLLDPILTVRENLYTRAGLYASTRRQRNQLVSEVQQAIDLSDIIDRPYGLLSGGQRRRADVAASLIHKPKVLFLDEPTTGLDPQTRQSIWQTLTHLRETQGMTLFLTTHYMEEAAASDYIVVIDHGQVAAQGTPTQLKTQYASDQLVMETTTGRKVVSLTKTTDAIDILNQCRDQITSFEVRQGSMDDVFLNITGRSIRV